MTSFVKAAKVKDVPPGTLKSVRVNGKMLALAHIGGKFFAVDDTCTHAGCSLGSEGKLGGNVITCGCHGARFDIRSGKVLALPAPAPVASYPVKVEGSDILVGI